MGKNPRWLCKSRRGWISYGIVQQMGILVHEALQPHLQMSQQTHFASPDKKARTSTGKQTKRSKNMIRDYNEVKTALLPQEHASVTSRQKSVTPIVIDDALTMPVHARILRVTPKRGEDSDSKLVEVAFGTPWDEFWFILPICLKASQALSLKPSEITRFGAVGSKMVEEVAFKGDGVERSRSRLT